MSAQIATFVCVLGILGFFLLDRDRKDRPSKGLWVPVAWLWVTASREVSFWFYGLNTVQPAGASTVLDPNAEGNPIDRWVFTGLMILAIAVLARRKRQVGTLLKTNLPLMLFFVYCALSILWSDFPDVAFKRWIKAVGDVLMVAVVMTDPERLAGVKRLLTRTAFLLVPLSVLFIKYYPSLGRWYKSADGHPVYVGVATNKNLLGVLCLVAGLASLWRLVIACRSQKGSRKTQSLIVHAAILAMVGWLFWMAQSLTSLACFVLTGALMVASSLKPIARRPAVVHILVLVVVCLSFSVLFVGLDPGALEAMGKDPTLTGRTEVWDLCLRLSKRPLIGAGFESFWMGPRLREIWSVYWWHPNEAHNGYLEVFLNLGWVGVTMLAVLIVTGYRNITVALRSNQAELARLRLAYLVVAVVYSFTEAGFRMLDPIWIMFLLATIAVPKSSLKKLRPPAASELQDAVRRQSEVRQAVAGVAAEDSRRTFHFAIH